MICTSEVKKYIKSVSVSVKSITLNAASLRFTVSHKHGGHATSFHGLKHSGIDGGTATDFIFAEAPYLKYKYGTASGPKITVESY